MSVSDLPVIADEALRDRRDMFTGANTDDVHLRGVDVGRDISVGQWADLREVAAGEPCPRCGEPLELIEAIEVGHIFKLGDRYSKVFGADVLGPDGKATPLIMGSYGIGVERAMAAIVDPTTMNAASYGRSRWRRSVSWSLSPSRRTPR